MQKKWLCLYLITALLISGCQPEQNELSQQQLDHYLEAISSLKDQNLQDLKANTQLERDKLEQTVKKAGFNNVDDFIKTHTDISWALAQNKTEAVVGDVKQNVQQGLDKLGESLNLETIDLKQQGQQMKAESKQWWNVFSSETKEFSQNSLQLIDKNMNELKQALNS